MQLTNNEKPLEVESLSVSQKERKQKVAHYIRNKSC